MPEDQITISQRDERTITVPVGSMMNDLRRAATNDSDWRLKTVDPIQVDRGNQRDPYVVTTGVNLIFERVLDD